MLVLLPQSPEGYHMWQIPQNWLQRLDEAGVPPQHGTKRAHPVPGCDLGAEELLELYAGVPETTWLWAGAPGNHMGRPRQQSRQEVRSEQAGTGRR